LEECIHTFYQRSSRWVAYDTCLAPFFGFLFDITGSYLLSFTLFIMALVSSALLSLLLRPPQKQGARFTATDTKSP
jgi:hypothetical protein